jgi:hypothetical protein
MERKSQQGISLFVRDEQTGRFILNAKALQALGINPVEAQQRGYPTWRRFRRDRPLPKR